MTYNQPEPAYVYEAPKPDWMEQAHIAEVGETDSGKYLVTVEMPDTTKPVAYLRNGTPAKTSMIRTSFYCSRSTWAKYKKLMELQMTMPMQYAYAEAFEVAAI